MCGRFVSTSRPEEVASYFDASLAERLVPAAGVADDADGGWANYNVAPTNSVLVVLERADTRWVDRFRWGLVPFWAKDPSVGSRMINARAETLAEKPAYRQAFRKRRCIIPADGFYEWQAPAEGVLNAAGKKPPKQPYFLHPADGTGLAMAGLYEWWRDPEVTDDEDPRAWLLSTTIITTAARDNVGRIHDRMPVAVLPEQRAAWLDPQTPGKEILAELLAPTPAGFWDIYPVSTAVNSVRNQGPQLLDPVEPGAGQLPLGQ